MLIVALNRKKEMKIKANKVICILESVLEIITHCNRGYITDKHLTLNHQEHVYKLK